MPEVTQQVKTQDPKFPVLILCSQTSVLPGAMEGIKRTAQAAKWQLTVGFSVLEARGSAGDCDRLESPGLVPGKGRSPAWSRNVGTFYQSICFGKAS